MSAKQSIQKTHLAGSHELTILVSPLTIESQAGGGGGGGGDLGKFLTGPLRFKNMTPYLLGLSLRIYCIQKVISSGSKGFRPILEVYLSRAHPETLEFPYLFLHVRQIYATALTLSFMELNKHVQATKWLNNKSKPFKFIYE